MKRGDKIEFTASQVVKGNPVTGIFIFADNEWLVVILTKKIKGYFDEWDKGEEKTFNIKHVSDISIKP